MAITQNYGTGRRKSSTARVFLRKGTGNITVNGRPLDEFFGRETGRMIVRQPLELTKNTETFDITVTTTGGGSSSDFYSFTLAEQMWVTFTLTPDSASAMPVLGLFQGSSVATGTLASATDDDAGDSVSRLTFNMKLSAGTYYTAVMGYRAHWWDFDGGGDAGWDYRLKLSGWTPAAPVPEASTLAMMMAGLGLLGLASRRRRSAA